MVLSQVHPGDPVPGRQLFLVLDVGCVVVRGPCCRGICLQAQVAIAAGAATISAQLCTRHLYLFQFELVCLSVCLRLGSAGAEDNRCTVGAGKLGRWVAPPWASLRECWRSWVSPSAAWKAAAPSICRTRSFPQPFPFSYTRVAHQCLTPVFAMFPPIVKVEPSTYPTRTLPQPFPLLVAHQCRTPFHRMPYSVIPQSFSFSYTRVAFRCLTPFHTMFLSIVKVAFSFSGSYVRCALMSVVAM